MGQTGYLSLMDDAGYLRSDLRLQDNDLRAKLAEKLAKQDDDDIVVSYNFYKMWVNSNKILLCLSPDWTR